VSSLCDACDALHHPTVLPRYCRSIRSCTAAQSSPCLLFCNRSMTANDTEKRINCLLNCADPCTVAAAKAPTSQFLGPVLIPAFIPVHAPRYGPGIKLRAVGVWHTGGYAAGMRTPDRNPTVSSRYCILQTDRTYTAQAAATAKLQTAGM
jgi:hypothetical protein